MYVERTARPAGSTRLPQTEHVPGTGIDTIPPPVPANLFSGLIEALAGPPYSGAAGLPALGSSLHMDVDDLFPVAETLQMLRLVEIEGGDIRLTDAGQAFAAAGFDERKRFFQHHLLSYVPLAGHVRRVLDERASHQAPRRRFSDELEDHMTAGAAEQTLRAVIGWGRYAEAFSYDDGPQMFSLENPA